MDERENNNNTQDATPRRVQVNHDDETTTANEQDRRRRALAFLFASLLLLMVLSAPSDTKLSDHNQSNSNTSKLRPSVDPRDPSTWGRSSQKVNDSDIAKAVEHAPERLLAKFPANVSGSYFGSFAVSNPNTLASWNQSSINATVDFSPQLRLSYFSSALNTDDVGSVKLRMSGYKTALPGVLAVAASVSLQAESTYSGSHDVPFMHGLYVDATGELTLGFSPSAFRLNVAAAKTKSRQLSSLHSQTPPIDTFEHESSDARKVLQNDSSPSSTTKSGFNNPQELDTEDAIAKRFESLSPDLRCAVVLKGRVAPVDVYKNGDKEHRGLFSAMEPHPTYSLDVMQRHLNSLGQAVNVVPTSSDGKTIDVDTAINSGDTQWRTYLDKTGASPSVVQIRGQLWSTNCVFADHGSIDGAKTAADIYKVAKQSNFKRPLTMFNISASAIVIDKELVESKAITFALFETALTVTQMVLQLQQLVTVATAQAPAMRMSLLSLGVCGVFDAFITLLYMLVGVVREALFSAFLTLAFLKLIQFSVLEMRLMMLIWKSRRPEAFAQGWDAIRRSLAQLYARFYAGLLLCIILSYLFISEIPFLLFLANSYWVPQIVHNVHQGQSDGFSLRYLLAISAARLFMPLYFFGCPSNFVVAMVPGVHISTSLPIVLSSWMILQVLVLLAQRRFGARFFIPKVLLPQQYNYHRRIQVENGRVLPSAAYPARPATTASTDDSEETSQPSRTALGRIVNGWIRDARTNMRSIQSYVRAVRSRIQEQRTSSRNDTTSSGPTRRRGYAAIETETFSSDSSCPGTTATAPYAEDHITTNSPGAADIEDGEIGELTCLICMCELDQPLNPTQYMVTPCNHLFHAECLQRWLEVKLECPTCRQQIPPPLN